MMKKYRERLKEFLHAQATEFLKKWAVVRGFFSNIDNISSVINRYATMANFMHSLLGVLSMLPVIIGPIGLAANIIQLFTNPEASLATKLIGVITQTGSSTTNIASLFLQAIAAPLALIGGALGLIKDMWNLGELLYRCHYKKEEISSAKLNEAIHGVILSTISLIASVLLITPLMPLGYGILLAVGAYRLADAFGYNPLKKFTSWFNEESKKEETAIDNTEKTTIQFENAVKPSTTLINDILGIKTKPEANNGYAIKPLPAIAKAEAIIAPEENITPRILDVKKPETTAPSL